MILVYFTINYLVSIAQSQILLHHSLASTIRYHVIRNLKFHLRAHLKHPQSSFLLYPLFMSSLPPLPNIPHFHLLIHLAFLVK